MDKRTVGRADRTDGTDGQEAKQPNEWTNGRMDERTEQDRADRAGQSRQSRQSRTNKQRDEAERRSRQAKQTDCRLLAPPFGRFAKHRTESCRRQKKRQSAPEKPDGSGNRERKPGAETGSGNREQIGRKWRPGADRTGADRPKRRYGISGRLFRYVRRR